MNPEPTMQLECRHIALRYPGTPTAICEELSFRMPGPGFNALFGPSGVGKTSLARLLTGELNADRGDLRLAGIDKVLYTYNTERLPGWAAVGKHLERITTPRQRNQRDQLVELCGMTPYLGSRFAQLSLGQKNRINLIRYLLQDFEMLIMDESLANVDEPTREKILLGIKARFPDKFFLYISHNVIEVSKFCRHILVMTGTGQTASPSMVTGQDFTRDHPLEQEPLERTMLEIMNAA